MQKLQDITFTGKTDTGLKRDHNEDNFVSAAIGDSSVLLCCIDGVGGMAGGAVCSDAVAKKMEQYIKDMQPDDLPAHFLKKVLVRINDEIIALQNEMPEYNEMACVLTAILVDTKYKLIYMVHVGDTRLYEYTDGQLVKLSHDHSPIGIREEMGILTEAEAMAHPKRNIIERCIGDMPLDDDTEYIETATYPLKEGATYLLCSDGLTDMVTADGISQILAEDTDVDTKTDKLIAAANGEGGKDNITVLLLHNPDLRTEEEKLADTLVENKDISISEARLIPDNTNVETDTSSQLLEEPASNCNIPEGEIPTPDKEEAVVKDKEENPEKEDDRQERREVSCQNNGRTIFLSLVVCVLVGAIVWMGWDIHTIKLNQEKMMTDTVLLRTNIRNTGIQQPDDTLVVDSTKFMMVGDSLVPIAMDSLRTDSLKNGN